MTLADSLDAYALRATTTAARDGMQDNAARARGEASFVVLLSRLMAHPDPRLRQLGREISDDETHRLLEQRAQQVARQRRWRLEDSLLADSLSASADPNVREIGRILMNGRP
jgi:hypothetical protein